jgi:hypothetical protein
VQILSNLGIRASSGKKEKYIVATGGDIVGTYSLGGNIYKYHQFNESGNFTVTEVGDEGNNQIEFLIIAGGGSNIGSGGGAGAGGYLSSVQGELSGRNTAALTPITVNSLGNYSFIVGAIAGNSSAFGLTATRGGNGGGTAQSGQSGGSGGGGGFPALSCQTSTIGRTSGGGAGVANQGFNGGGGRISEVGLLCYNRTGGGGGAGSVGGSAGGTSHGAGGAGINSSITGVSVLRARGNNGSASTPSLGANTGGGARGGVVIVRYLTDSL